MTIDLRPICEKGQRVKKGDGCDAGFCLTAASGKGGKAVQPVFFRKIAERKTIAKDHCFVGNTGEEITEVLVQHLQLGNVCAGIFLIGRGVLRVDITQILFDCPGN